MRRPVGNLLIMLAASVAVAGCTLNEPDVPPLTGPSEWGMSITLEIKPDQLTQDGRSKAEIKIRVRDANGAPWPERVQLKLEQFVDNVRDDIGTLMPSTVWTASDGTAMSEFTTPSSQTFRVVEIRVTPVGSNFSNAVSRVATIRLTPVGVIKRPSGIVARFTFSPTTPVEDQPVLFDASTSAPQNAIVSYRWDFGDGGTAAGPLVTHTFADARNYFVTLTVTDEDGFTDLQMETVTVGAVAGPTADFVFSPTAPAANQPVNFNAAASSAPEGSSIASYNWDFGDGTFGSGQTATHSYA